MLFMQHCHLEHVKGEDIGVIAVSDHAPVLADIEILAVLRTTFQSCLNNSVLMEQQVVENTRELEFYFSDFSVNMGGEVDPFIVWEAHKTTYAVSLSDKGLF